MKCKSFILLLASVFCIGVNGVPNYYSDGQSMGQSNSDNVNNLDGMSGGGGGGCISDRLAVYKVVLHTYWTRDLFPKHYPDWRPPAQWTKTSGKCVYVVSLMLDDDG